MMQPPQRGRHKRGIVLLAQAFQHLQLFEDRLVPEATPARKNGNRRLRENALSFKK